MSRSAGVNLVWGNGRHQFRLAIAELDELDELCQVGPGYLLAQVTRGIYGGWKARAVRETIRLGLVGGGLPPAQAVLLVERYFDRSPIAEHLITAQAILTAAIVGDENDPPGEQAGNANHPSPTDASASAPSGSVQEPSTLPMSDASASGSSTGSMLAGSEPTAAKPTRRARRGRSRTPNAKV